MFIFGSTNVLIRIKREHVLYGLMRRQKKKIYIFKKEKRKFFFLFFTSLSLNECFWLLKKNKGGLFCPLRLKTSLME